MKKRCVKQGVALMMSLVMMLLLLPTAFAWSNPYSRGQCTWYAYQRWGELMGCQPPTIAGNAGGWYDNAASKGLERGNVPRVGAIACWNNGTGTDAGHVAIVEEVTSSYIKVSEYNWAVSKGYSTAVIYYDRINRSSTNKPKRYFKGYIYLPRSTKDPSGTPTNPTINKSQIWYDLKDTIEISAHADGATSYYMSMFKDGNKIIGQDVNGGKFSISASRYGEGEYSAYFSCTNSNGTVDTKWIDFSVVGAAGYSDVRVSKSQYSVSDTVKISVDTVCAKGQVIGIDKEGVGRVVTEQCDPTYSISAQKLGTGSFSAYFSVYNGSGGIDTKRVYFNIKGEPTNPTINKSQIWYDLKDTIEISAHADGATSYYMSMFKDGNKIIGQDVNGGKFSISASRYGEGEYSAYFSCTNSNGTVDTKWIDFSVVGAAGYSDVRVSKSQYSVSDTVKISVDTVCAKGQVIGIDKEGVGRVITEQCDSTYSISAQKLGTGSFSAYFSVYNGSGGVDTKRVYFKILA